MELEKMQKTSSTENRLGIKGVIGLVCCMVGSIALVLLLLNWKTVWAVLSSDMSGFLIGIILALCTLPVMIFIGIMIQDRRIRFNFNNFKTYDRKQKLKCIIVGILIVSCILSSIIKIYDYIAFSNISSVEEYIEYSVKKAIDEKPTSIIGIEDGYIIDIDAKEGFSREKTLLAMQHNATSIFENIYTLDSRYIPVGDVSIRLHIPLTDAYGITQNKVVLTVTLDAITASQINWNSFLYDSLPNIAKEHRINPEF